MFSIFGRMSTEGPCACRVYTPCTRMRAHTPTVGAAVYTSVAGCAQRIRAHTPTVAVKVQTCWTFKASADHGRHSSKSWKRSKVTEGRRGVLHRDVCGHIPTHTLACLVCDLNRTPNCYGKTWRFLCPFFRNLHLRENLARDCFTSTVSTVTNSCCAKYLYPSTLLWQINCCNL